MPKPAKLTAPADAPFAVDVPDLEVENIGPGETVELDDLAPHLETVVSLVMQGWTVDSATQKAVDAYLVELEAALAADWSEDEPAAGDADGITAPDPDVAGDVADHEDDAR